MQQRHILLFVICTILLSACGGGNNSTATPPPVVQQNNAPIISTLPIPTEIVPTTGPREYSDGTQEVTLPETGTIVPPATEDPSAGKLFDSVALERMGGTAGKPLNIMLLSDGTLTRDGVTSTLPADQVKQISDQLDQMGFFGLDGAFQGVGTSPDVYTYYITAKRDGSERTLIAQDGFIPPQITNLLQILSQLGATS